MRKFLAISCLFVATTIALTGFAGAHRADAGPPVTKAHTFDIVKYEAPVLAFDYQVSELPDALHNESFKEAPVFHYEAVAVKGFYYDRLRTQHDVSNTIFDVNYWRYQIKPLLIKRLPGTGFRDNILRT